MRRAGSGWPAGLVAVALLATAAALAGCAASGASQRASATPTAGTRVAGTSAASTATAVAPAESITASPVRSTPRTAAAHLRAQSFAGLGIVGPLFPAGASHSHGCVATVVASRSGDSIMTAAHCLHPDERGIEFAPGYRGGVMPYGLWTIVNAQADSVWLTRHDKQHDVAVFTVASRRIDGRLRTLQQVVGAAAALGTAPASGARATIVGYNRGTGDYARRCTAATTRTSGYPTLRCSGFGSGSSGSPWLLFPTTGRPGYTLVGVIGGLHNGGCTTTTSYSPAFGAQARAVLAAAVAGRPSVRGTGTGGDQC